MSCRGVLRLLLLALSVSSALNAQTPRLSFVPLLNLSQPVYLTSAKDGTNRRFIVEQVGRIQVLQAGATTPTLFLDISSRVLFGGERGLLGLAFHPHFATNRLLYVNYTRQPDGATVVAEYRDGIEQRVLFTVAQPYENHNGGMIEFGPDGYLYVGMGDGGSGNDPENRSQNLNELLGKMLRVNVDVPGSGPEIYAYGFRNPWRFSFDRLTGQFWVGDVGQSTREEIDIVTQGGNYGWRVWEGTFCTQLGPAPCDTSGYIFPITEYANTGPDGRCSIIGGYVYRGTQGTLPYGAYIFGDLCSGEILMFKEGRQTVLAKTSLQISSFGEDEQGELYVIGINGPVLRLVNPDAMLTAQRAFVASDTIPFVASTAGSASGLSVGYGRIQADAGKLLPSGLAIFSFQRGGVLVSEASVPASQTVTTARVLAQVGPNINTGIALANPNDVPATISFYFTDSSGKNFGNGTTTILPRQQISAFLNEQPFNGGNSIGGTFSFTSDNPIAAIALRGIKNQRGDFLMTTLPVIEVGPSRQGGTTIAHFANGAGWATELIFVNPSDDPISGTAVFISPHGEVLQTVPYSIAPRSSGGIAPATRPGSILQTGSVKLSTNVAAVAIFSYNVGGVTTVSQAAVAAIGEATNFLSYVENGGAIRSGIAVANPSATPVDVTLEINGVDATINLPPSGQRALFVDELPEFAALGSFQSVLRVMSSAPIAMVGLRGHINERGEFLITTTNPLNQTSLANAAELFFPQFAEGAGYGMQFIFFGPNTSGTLYLFDQAGNPAALVFR